MPDAILTRDVARNLADAFSLGWSRGRLDLLLGVFAEGAVFIETPFSSPATGIEAIRSWASDIPYHQSETSFTTGEIFLAGPWFSTEFKLVFRRRKTGEWVEARGAAQAGAWMARSRRTPTTTRWRIPRPASCPSTSIRAMARPS